jgi:succinate dehydrogenase hydrophobic anchor subunit
MLLTTTISEDEEENDDSHQFFTPSLDIVDASIPPKFLHISTPANDNKNDNDSIETNDLPQMTSIISPPSHTYANLSSSSSESSLVRPLLNDNHQIRPIYSNNAHGNIEDLTNKMLPNSLHAGFTNYSSWIKCYICDMFISAFLITPLVNLHWRGAWDLLDLHFLPKNARLSAALSTLFGLILLYLIYLIQNILQSFYEKQRKTAVGKSMARLYTLIFALAYINQWRGLWNLLDFTSNDPLFLLLETLISVVCLLIMKSVYNLNSAPFLIGTDTEYYFLIGSKFQISVSASEMFSNSQTSRNVILIVFLFE